MTIQGLTDKPQDHVVNASGVRICLILPRGSVYFCAAPIAKQHWIICAIRKHVVPQKALAGACVAVCVEKALDDGIVVAGLEVIEAGFFDCGLSLRSIWDGFLIVKLRVNVPAPGGQMPSRTYEK